METNQLENIFQSAFNFDNWKEVIKNYFNNVDFYLTPENKKEDKNAHSIAKTIVEFGSAQLADNKIIKFYNVELKEDKHVTKNRVGLRSLIHNEVIPGDVDAILVVFHTKDDSDWRLTFISKAMYWDDDFNENKLETSPRRYTYVLGEDESVKTAVKQFEKLENEQITIKHLIELFNVEKLNKNFFDEYKKHYNKFWSYLLDNNKYKKLFPSFDEEKQEKAIRDFTKKLLGRIVFLHFLQKKGWMGCDPHPTEWENGEKQFLLKLLNGFQDKEHFHSKCLTYLFFNTLNAKRENDTFQVEGLNNDLDKTKIPYLNGGLFETDKEVNAKNIDFPFSYFQDLFEFFGQYNFTIDENSPEDHEVGIDPEMLGHIFENLLEENKEKGAFYTPKEIVQYMTQESLIQYLQTHLGEHYEIEEFIRNHSKGDETAKENFIRDNAKKIEELLDKVKICDPAIGSGAFPMGMLHEIFKAKMALDWTLERSEVKKSIIQNSIYGVDLESGAVDIARLRFWLALVVDENTPQALPNLDYKIMQGNSLLESFEGIDLSQIHEGIAIEIDESKSEANLFSEELKKKEDVENQEKLVDLIHKYFDLDDPEEKKELHNRIDKQVLNNIYFTLYDHKSSLIKEHKKLSKKIKSKSASLTQATQKIKYESESKDAKNLKKLNSELEDIANKQQKLKELYHSNDRPFFLWHLMFKEVFENGGFDIVIGNPPYVQLKWLADSELYSSYVTYSKSGDIYCLFYELATTLVKKNGVSIYITSNKWLRAAYGKKTRDYFLKNTQPLKLIDFMGLQIFETAAVDTNILLWSKENNGETTKTIKFEKGITIKTGITDFIKNNNVDVQFELELPWLLLSKNEKELKLKIEKYAQFKLKDNYHLNYGILTGANQAFIIDEKSKNKLLSLDSKNNELIKPILRGKDIIPYYYTFSNVYLIATHNGIKKKNIPPVNLDSYPTLLNYFLSFGSSFENRGEKGDNFYNLRNCAYLNLFEEEKIIYSDIVQSRGKFYLDQKGFYTNDTAFIINGENLKSLVCILNSSLLSYAYAKFYSGGGLGDKGLRYKKEFIGNLPIIDTQFVLLEIMHDYIVLTKEYQSNSNNDKLKYKVISDFLIDIVDAVIFEMYFPEEFLKSNIKISELLNTEISQLSSAKTEPSLQLVDEFYTRLKEKKNPLRNQIKLMKIELKQLLNPILSV